MKECFKCHEALPLSEFYRHPMMGDGHLGKCKRCTRRDVRDNYAANRGQYQEYDRRRWTEDHAKRVATLKASKLRHPQHAWARSTLHNAVARGEIVKGQCEVCGAAKVDAHHDDYTRPLDVRWLCRRHHMQEHRMDADARTNQ